MRVTRAAEPPADRRRVAERRPFDSALAKALEARDRRRAAGSAGEAPRCGRGEGGRARGRDAEPSAGSLPSAAATTSASPWPAAGHGAEPSLPELREAARAIPPAIWAGRLEGAPAVELGFGQELSVVLRQGAGGVELAVRPSAALERAARADLPALVRALRARGVVVARAEVRGASGKDGGTARIRTGE